MILRKALPGDLILYGGSAHESLASRAVEAGEIILTGNDSQTQFSHVAIYVGGGEQIEAIWPRVKPSLIDPKRTFSVYRYRKITNSQRRDIMLAAESHVGEWYNLLYVLSFGILKIGGTDVCSTFGQHCYAEAGLIVNGKTPNTLSEDKHLRLIGTHGITKKAKETKTWTPLKS